MKLSLKKVAAMVLAFVSTLAILKMAQWIYTKSAVRSPLLKTVKAIPGVANATLSGSGQLNVWLNARANLLDTYHQIEARTSQSGANSAFKTIAIESNPSGTMTSEAQKLRFIIAQGQSTGQFVAMRQEILAAAQKAGMQSVVQLGNVRLFLTLKQGAHRFYEVIPLNLEGGNQHG